MQQFELGPWKYPVRSVALTIKALKEVNLTVLPSSGGYWFNRRPPTAAVTIPLQAESMTELDGLDWPVIVRPVFNRQVRVDNTYDLVVSMKIPEGSVLRVESYGEELTHIASRAARELVLQNDLPSGLGESTHAQRMERMTALGVSPDEAVGFIPLQEEFYYRRYKIGWRGWKGSFNTVDFVGQWIATWDEGVEADAIGKGDSFSSTYAPQMLYSSYPGGQGLIAPGCKMDIEWKDGQTVWTSNTDRKENIQLSDFKWPEAQEDARLRMIALIDEVLTRK